MSRDSSNWFHGKLSREDAEILIKREYNDDGTFLVRESSTALGDYVLTLIFQNEVYHFQIRRHGEDAFFSIDDKVKILHGLDTLIEFYQKSANGLVTKLVKHIAKEAPPNDSRRHGVTNLLHRATKENNECVVSELLKCGYRNVDAKNQDGQTAVHLAALHCDERILRMLLQAGVNVNCMDTSGNMPLHYACRTKSTAIIQILIEASANVQGRNIQNGYVPLHEAAKHGNLEAVKVLLAANAPLLPRTVSGEFPIDLAKETGQVNVVEFLNCYKPSPAKTVSNLWFHGTLKREEAVEALMNFASKMETEIITQQKQEELEKIVIVDGDNKLDEKSTGVDTSGCFLVRFSERMGGGSGYVLTLLWNKIVKHFIISQSSKYLYIDEGPYLPSLEHLVEHFMRFSDGLPTSLKYPVKPKPKPPLPLFSTMPRSHPKKISDGLISPTEQTSTTTTTDMRLTPKTEAGRKLSLNEQTSTQSAKKKSKESVLNTFMRSPKKALSLDGMASLRKSKTKSKTSKRQAENIDIEATAKLKEIEQAQILFENLKFEVPASDEFYNVPRNNTAFCLELENKTDAEVEYFTKSDVAIERERMTEDINNSNNMINEPLIGANGYIPAIDVRIFTDHLGNQITMPQKNLEASAAELREFSNHPERLDSIISNASTESSILNYLNRQNSNSSTVTTIQNSMETKQTKLNYLIPSECLELETIIGEGEFGSVYKGVLRMNETDKESQIVAIKTLRDEHCRSNKQEFLREASVMIRLQHHCIVQLIGIAKRETLMMVQELVPFGSMLHFILDHKQNINPHYELKLWASQIACGMQYLESRHFVHRDLAARNILLASRNQAKISDFGLSRALGSDNDCYQASQGGKWPIKWYAPESFNNGLFSHASDVWSFGVTLWEMFSLGEPPYGDIRGVDAIQLIENGKRLGQPELCPDHVYEIMMNCWNYNAKDRPTFRHLTEFFVKDPNYQNLIELVNTKHIS